MPLRLLLRRAAPACACLGLAACSRTPPAPPPVSVAVARVVRADLANRMTLQAEFEPYQDILVHAKVSGYVSRIPVDIGDRLKAGDLIATLEVPELGDELAAAVAAEQRAAADHEAAHLNFQRLREVARTQPNLVAQQDLDDAAGKDAAGAAALASAQAEADRYRALEDYTRITAPFAGVIIRRSADLGALIQAGTSSNPEPLVELAEDDLLRLRFPVPEAEAPSIRAGEEVRVSVGALHDDFSGRIVRDSGAIDRSTRTLLTEVDVPNPGGRIKAGMYAAIELPLQSARQALAVPLPALAAGDRPSVFVVGPDGVLEQRPVAVGLRTASRAEITGGLREGEQVVVSDLSELHPGDKVAARPLDPSESE